MQPWPHVVQCVQADASQRDALFTTVFQKVLVIAACALVRRCEQWRAILPPHLLRIAPPGALCALFWPPPGCELHAPRAPASAATPALGAPDDSDDLLKAGSWWRALSTEGVAAYSRALIRHVTLHVSRHNPLSPAAPDRRRSLDDCGSATFKLAHEPSIKGASATALLVW